MAGHAKNSSGQRMASLAVLALLCAIGAYLLARQPQLNPAVLVSLRAPAPRTLAGPSSGPTSAATSAATSEATAGLGSGESAGPPAGPATGESAVAAPSAPGAKAGLTALLPDSVQGQSPGVQALAAAEAFTPATLSDKIDGKAEMYLAAGFAAMACRSYQTQASPPGRVEVYLYRMKTPDAAFAVFSGQRRPGAAQSPLAKNGYLTENALFLTSGADYLEVIGDRTGQRPALESLAKAILAGLGSARAGRDTVPDAAPDASRNAADSSRPGARQNAADLQPGDLFPRAGIKADSLRLAVADAFGCQGLTSIYTVEYDSTDGKTGGGAAALLSRRKNPAEAKAQLELYRRFLVDNGFAAQPAPGAPAGAVVLAMEGVGVELLFTRGQWLAGVHEAPTLDAALRLAAAFDAALKAKGIAP